MKGYKLGKKVIIKGMMTWDEEGKKEIPCEDEWEVGAILTKEKMKALGLLPGMKTKSFSEMTEEEQKLFTEEDDDTTEE